MKSNLKLGVFGFAFASLLAISLASCSTEDANSLNPSEVFVKYYGTEAEEKAIDLLETAEGYLILGSRKIGEESSYYLIRTDSIGNNVWWEHLYTVDTLDVDGEVINVQCVPSRMHLYDNDTRLVIAGTATFLNTDHIFMVDVDLMTGEVSNSYLYKFRDDRDVDSSVHEFKSTRGADVVFTGNEFVILGSTFAKSNLNDATENWSVLLMNISKDFQTIKWERLKGFSGDDFGERLLGFENKYYFLAGMSTTEARGFGGVDVVIEKYDIIGGGEDAQEIYGTSSDDNPSNFIYTNPGMAITGTTGRGVAQYAFILRIQGEDKLQGGSFLPVSYQIPGSENSLWNTQGADIVKTAAGGYYVVGQVNNFNSGTILKSSEVLILPLDGLGVVKDGDVQEYGSVDDDSGNAVIVKPDGSLVIAATINFGGEADMITLLKTNKKGKFKGN